jgi:ATP-dependent Clp protease ATP-binding subunit ClpA
MKEYKVQIGKLFKYLETKGVSFEYDVPIKQELFPIQIQNEIGNWCNVPFFVKKRDVIYNIGFESFVFSAGSKHLLCTNNSTKECTFVKDLKINDKPSYFDEKIVSITTSKEEDVFDLQIDTPSHLYKTTNGLINHNTSVVLGLAQRIAAKTVPDAIKDYEIWNVDLGAMLAGCKYRGEFEQRVDGMIKEAVKRPRCVLCIDEIHNLVGAGNGGSGALDAANMFRPYLSSGELKVIGATTFNDYKTIERDGALARRFQNIDVLAPSEKETLEILVGLKSSYEKFHNVEYPEDTLSLAAHLASNHIKDRSLPDSAIDVMDEVGARAKVLNFKEGEVGVPVVITEEMVEHVVARMAKVPPRTVSKDDGTRLQNLEKDLKAVVYGQDDAVEKVVTAIKRSRAGFRKKNKPVANLIFAGRSGSGKSHLAKSLADCLGAKLLRWDMSELSEKNSVAKWVGAAAGYVGYEEGGLLVDQISKNPNSVLLLDEIEKASTDVFNVMLGIMDNATLTDSHGKTADFSNVTIIMTSNVGASRIGEKTIGFDDHQKKGKTNVDAIMSEYDKKFSPEFRNRIDAVTVFNDLGDVELRKIVGRELEEFKEQLADKKVDVELTESAIEWLVKNGYDEKLGARPLVRLFEKEVKDRSIDPVLFGELKDGGKATIDLCCDHLIVITTPQIKTVEEPVEVVQ